LTLRSNISFFKQKLQKELNSKQADLDCLNRQLQEQVELATEANSERKELKELLRITETELVGAKSSVVNKSVYSDLQKQRDTLHAAFEDSKIAIEELNKHRMKKDEEIKELTNAVKAASAEIESLKHHLGVQIEETDKSKIRHDQKLERIAELETQLLVSNNIVEDMQKELKAREIETSNLTTLLEKERNAFALMKETLTDKDKESSLLLTQMALFKSQEEQTELYKTQVS